MHIPELPVWWYWTIVLSPAATALWRGDWALRLVAGIILFQVFDTYSPLTSWAAGWPIDAMTLAVCLALVLRGCGYWTVLAAASAVLSLATHALVPALGATRWVEASMQLAWGHALSMSVIVGSLLRRSPPAVRTAGTRSGDGARAGCGKVGTGFPLRNRL